MVSRDGIHRVVQYSMISDEFLGLGQRHLLHMQHSCTDFSVRRDYVLFTFIDTSYVQAKPPG